MERSAGSSGSGSMLRARLPDLGGAAWGDVSARGAGGSSGGPARALSPMGLLSQGFLVR